MPIPPKNRPSQKHFVQSAIRFPPELRAELQEAAERNGRSFNAEVIARLQESPLEAIVAELAEVKSMVRRLLDQA